MGDSPMHLRLDTLFLFLVLPGLGGCQALADGDRAQRPNILVLINDDQRWDQVSCAEQPLIPELRTPNIDRLAQGGVYFRDAFVTTPICAVSRASIVTGKYASTHGMNHFQTPLAPEVLGKSYPAVLHDHGYWTGMLGKWGVGTEGTQDVFDVFDAWANQGAYFHATDEGRIHNAEWLARRARGFLESRPPGMPFCLTISYKSPHHPYQPDERDAQLFDDLVIPSRPTDTREHYGTLSPAVMEGSLNRWCYFDERRDEATRERFEKDFLRCIVSLDRSVGMVMKLLEDLELEENTYVIFLSDHGYLWGEHGLGGKWLLYEESIRVPLIVHGPGLPAAMRGGAPEALALNIDVAPTILDIAGAPIPPVMDGMSLWPLLSGESPPARRDFFMEHVGVIDVEQPIPDSRGVRTREWKYIRYLGVEPEVEELYHLASDPLETRNLAADAEHAEDLARLRERYDDYLDALRE